MNKNTERAHREVQKNYLALLLATEKKALCNAFDHGVIGKSYANKRKFYYGVKSMFSEHGLDFDYVNHFGSRFSEDKPPDPTETIPIEHWRKILEWTKTYEHRSIGHRDYQVYCIFSFIFYLRLKAQELVDLSYNDILVDGQNARIVKGEMIRPIPKELYSAIRQYWASLPFDVGLGDSVFYNTEYSEINYHTLWHTVVTAGIKAQKELGINLGFRITPEVIFATAQQQHKANMMNKSTAA